MRYFVFYIHSELCECEVITLGFEDRIISEALITFFLINDATVDYTFEFFGYDFFSFYEY